MLLKYRRQGLSFVVSSLIALATLSLSQLGADVIMLGPIADTTLNEQNTNGNMGGYDFVAAGVDGTGNRRRGLLQFDLAGQIPDGATVNSAELILTVDGTGQTGNPSMFDLFRMLVQWEEGNKGSGLVGNGQPATEGESTWNNRQHPATAWAAPGGAAGVDYAATASSSVLVGGGGPVSWTGLATDIEAWLNDPTGNFGWMLLSQSESDPAASRTARRFFSRTAMTGIPVLVIDFSDSSMQLPGDANGDGKVDLMDFNILKANFGTSDATLSQGDFNGDATVDLTDFNTLKANFGTMATAAVPEPAGFLLAGAAFFLMAAVRLVKNVRPR